MPHAIFEFKQTGILDRATSERITTEEADFDNAREEWRTKILAPYVKYLDQQKSEPRSLKINTSFCGEKTMVEYILDQNFLEQIMVSYMCYGWEAPLKLLKIAKGRILPGALDFIENTMVLVESLIGKQLATLEKNLVELARKEWTDAKKKLEDYLTRYFHDVSKDGLGGGYTADFQDTFLEDKLLEKCADYSKYLKKFRFYQSKIDDRNYKDIGRRDKEGNRKASYQAMFEMWAAPQRKVIDKMSKLIKEIYDLCPPVVLILQELPDDIHSNSKYDSGMSKIKNRRPFGQLVFNNLVKIRNMLNDLLSSLNQPLQCDRFSSYFASKSRKSSENGIEAMVMNFVFMDKPNSENLVLVNYDLILLMYNRVIEQRPITWERAVLESYLNRLTEVIEKKRQDKKEWEARFGWIRYIAAGLSLLALLAVFPFGLGAVGVAPAIVTALAIIEVSAFLSAIIVIIHDLISLFAARNEEADALRQKLIELNQSDPEAFVNLSYVLARLHTYEKAISYDLVVTLVKLAAAQKLKPVAMAMQMEGYIGDMETLMQPQLIFYE